MATKATSPDHGDQDEAATLGDELDGDVYLVDCILAERRNHKRTEYLIKWQGYPEEESTWQTVEDITHGKDEILSCWTKDKEKIKKGLADKFNVTDFEKRVAIYRSTEKRTRVCETKKGRKNQKEVAERPFEKTDGNMLVSFDEDSDEDAVDQTQKGGDDEINDTCSNASTSSKSGNTKKRKKPLSDLISNSYKRARDSSERPQTLSNASVTDYASRPSTRPATSTTSSSASQSPNPHALGNTKAPYVYQSTAPTQGVFRNSQDEPQLRNPKSRNPERIYTPSHLRAATRRKQDGDPPDPKNLILQIPSEMRTRPSTHRNNSISTPVVSTMPTVSQGQQRKQKDQPESKPVSPLAQSIPLICCYFYSNRVCPEGERQCRFLHQQDQILAVATPIMHQQARERDAGSDRWPKYDDPPIVCGFECRGEPRCERDDTACAYAHWIPIKGNWHYHDHLIQKKKTCHFWAAGNCRNSAEDCSFAHETLGELVDPSPMACPKTITCYFWFGCTYNNGPPCRKAAEDCKFAHEIRPLLASPPHERSAPRPMDPRLLQNTASNPSNEFSTHFSSVVNVIPDNNLPRTAPKRRSSTPTSTFEQLSLRSADTLLICSSKENDVPANLVERPENLFTFIVHMGKLQVPVTFGELDLKLCSLLENYFGKSGVVIQARVSPWADIEAFITPIYNNKVATGKCLPPENEIEVAELADHLAHEGCALLLQAKDMTVILFPSRGNVEQADEEPPKQMIAFDIRIATGGPVEAEAERDQTSDGNAENEIRLWFRHTFDMDFEDLFTWPIAPHMVKKNVFLLLDDDREAEIEALARILRWSGAIVHVPDLLGSWSDFKNHNEGVVIFDERLIAYRDIPYLSYLLFCRFNFFQLTTDTKNGSIGLKRIFKTGHTLFLTDEVLIQEPEKVLEIIRHVKERNRTKVPGQESRRLFMRPRAADWLLKIAEDHIEDHKAGNISRALLWDEIVDLTSTDSTTENIDLTDGVVYEPSWIDMSNEDIYGETHIDTDLLLKAFDLIFCHYREHSRNWIVIHPSSEGALKQAEYWSTKYNNMKFMTVDDFKTKIIER
ncbi:uncharacterized protein PV09_05529 [Verruconis gallopava]|uniref:Chromo domain-containing protein n=1 Tax=Verruconis gallopava TaxID=253628 RepID=A0A0D2A975_9PEZI|nr:uncharacterized protein PV09_05529 [Verruconis gallopava]KIW03318.1 hypothetical protein PV09_05529 [Verruconis gallopava]